MTQAFNLSQFANKLNSSGQTDNTGLQNSAVTVTAGTGMSGGGSVALGSSVTLTNAGVTSVTAGTGISVSASTGGITVTNTSPGGGTGLGDIGSYAYLAYCATSNLIAGSTASGSDLRYANTITAYSDNFPGYFSNGDPNVSNVYTRWQKTDDVLRITNGNTGYTTPAGTTAMSGTWRAMYTVRARAGSYDSCFNQYYSYSALGLFVRVS